MIWPIYLPDTRWLPIDEAPKDGRLVFLHDRFGNSDIAAWSRGEWNCETGNLNDHPVSFAYITILKNYLTNLE